MKKYLYINFSFILLIVLSFIFTVISVNGTNQKTVLSKENIQTHLDEIASSPRSLFNLERHEEVVTYLKNNLLQYGLVNGDDVLVPSFDVQISPYDHYRDDETLTTHELKNVIAHLPANSQTPSNQAVLFMAHYDSVPMGPGASDDAIGISVMLDMIRYIQENQLTHDNDFIFAFVDGEEFGLLGSEIFIKEYQGFNQIVDRIKFAVNLESRGTSGTLIMFETSKHNYESIRLFSKVNSHLFTSSIANMVYQSMPNGTDYSNFKDLYQGFNVANLGGGENYHTQNDDNRHMGKSYLSQQANFVFNVFNETKNMDLNALYKTDVDAVFHSYLGLTVYYKPWVAFALGLITLMLALTLIILNVVKDKTFLKHLAKGFLGLFITIISGAIIGFIVYYVLNLFAALFRVIDVTQIGKISYTNTYLMVLFILLTTIATYAIVHIVLKRLHIKKAMLHIAYTLFISLLTVVLSFILKEVSYLFTWIAIPFLVLNLLKHKFESYEWYKKLHLNYLILAINIPILMPVIFLAALALGASLLYVLAVLVVLMILPLFNEQENDGGILLEHNVSPLNRLSLSLKYGILMLILLVPMIIGVSSRENISANLGGKQNIAVYAYDDALVLVKDEQTYLKVADYNTYPLVKKYLDGFSHQKELLAYTKNSTLAYQGSGLSTYIVSENEISVSRKNVEGFYEIHLLNPEDIVSITITIGTYQTTVNPEYYDYALKFVKDAHILFETKPNTKASIVLREVLINDPWLRSQDLFKKMASVENFKFNYDQRETIILEN